MINVGRTEHLEENLECYGWLRLRLQSLRLKVTRKFLAVIFPSKLHLILLFTDL